MWFTISKSTITKRQRPRLTVPDLIWLSCGYQIVTVVWCHLIHCFNIVAIISITIACMSERQDSLVIIRYAMNINLLCVGVRVLDIVFILLFYFNALFLCFLHNYIIIFIGICDVYLIFCIFFLKLSLQIVWIN